MTWEECKSLIDADYARLPQRRLGKLGYLITSHSFKITYWFRIGSYLKERGIWFKPVLLILSLLYKHYAFKTGIQLPLGTRVGGAFYLNTLGQ